jgi:hypothetical protein
MPFPSALSAGQITQIRQTTHTSTQYLLRCPNNIIWQTQPNENISDTVYAEFDWTGTLQGDSTDVREGMTVLITTDDSDLSTVVYRGRVRKAPSASVFFINETSATLSTDYYVTVLDDYDIFEKLERRIVTGTAYKDWDLAFSRLPPLITGLQSVYADTSGAATVTFTFTATAAITSDGATISTYTWYEADGTINSGQGTATLNVTFPGAATNEQRWVRLEVEDSNGTIGHFNFEVYTVNLADTTPTTIALDNDSVSIAGSLDEGFNLNVRVWAGFSSVLNQTRCSLLSVDDYDGIRKLAYTSGGTYEVVAGNTITGATSAATAVVQTVELDSGTWAGGNAVGSLWVNTQVGTFEAENLNVGANSNVATIASNSTNPPITQNIGFVGRLRQEGNATAGDKRHSVLQDARLTIEGFVTQLGRLHGAGLYLKTDATPTVWGEVDTLTIKRAIVFMLAWHSTFLTVSGVTFPSDSDDYVWPEFVIQEASLLEWVNSVADDHNAQLVIAGDGQSTFHRDARIAGVSGLTTVYNFVTSDLISYTLDYEYISTYAQAIIGAATYNTTSAKSTVYQGRAPAQAFGPGWETAPVNQQIMKTNLTDAQARVEAGSRVANYFATLNPRPRLTAELMSGFYWIVPTAHQLYTFTLAATDNTRGRAYTTADKWLCVDISYDYNPNRGYYTWNGTFELIVVGGAAGIQVTLVPDVNDLRLPTLPGISASMGGILDPLINYPLDDPDFELPGIDAGITQPQPWQPQPEVSCEVLNVSMKTGSIVTTSELSVFGAPYTVTVEGQGKVAGTFAPWSESFDFTTSNEGWSTGGIDIFPALASQGTYVAATGWRTTYVNDAYGRVRALNIQKTMTTFSGDSIITSAALTYDLTNSGNWDGTPNVHGVKYANNVNLATTGYVSDSSGSDKTVSASGLTQVSVSSDNIRIMLVTGRMFSGGDPGGQATAKALVVSGSGVNPFTGVVESRCRKWYVVPRRLWFPGRQRPSWRYTHLPKQSPIPIRYDWHGLPVGLPFFGQRLFR